MLLVRISLETVALLGFTWWVLGRFKDHRVGSSVQLAAFASWVLGFAHLLLLPVDVILLGVQNEKEQYYDALVGLWKTVYWLTFLMSWLVLPFLVEFSRNGEFNVEKRVCTSFRTLFFHWTILVCISLATVVYLIFVGHLSFSGISALAMASSNTYGLLCVIALLGYGIVSIPRSLWQLRYPENRIKMIYFNAVHAHEDQMEAIFTYEETVNQVYECFRRMLTWESASIVLTGEMQYVRSCLLQVIALIESESFTSFKQRNLPSKSRMADNLWDGSAVPPTLQEVVELHRRFRTALDDLRATELGWLELCIEAERLLEWDLKRDIPSSCLYPETSPVNRIRNTLMTTRWAARRLLTPQVYVVFATIAASFSIVVLWSELMMGWDDRFSIVGLLLSEALGPLAEMAVFSVLLYLVLCCYQALFTMRPLERYALRSHNNTSELSLLKVSLYQCRIQFSLGYNFLLLLNKPKVTEVTAYQELFRHMRLVHFFGTDFSVYAPILMVMLAGFTLSNGYAHVMKRVGIEQKQQLLFGCPDHEAKIHQGEKLIRKGIESHQATISKKIKEHDSSASYGFAFSNDAAKSLLAEEINAKVHEHDEEEPHIHV